MEVERAVHLWLLHVADHRGRWERTSFRDNRDNLDNLVSMVVEQFPWVPTSGAD